MFALHKPQPTPSQLEALQHKKQFTERLIVKTVPKIEEIAVVPERPHPNDIFGPVVCHRDFEPSGHVSIGGIIRTTARYFQISRLEMLSHRRSAHIALARQIAMYLAQTLTSKSYPEIGRRFGDRDHTTAMHAVRKIQGKILAGDVVVIEAVDSLTALFS